MSDLVNRSRFSNTMDNKIKVEFEELAKKTKIPKSKLLDEAVEDLLKKYAKEVKNK